MAARTSQLEAALDRLGVAGSPQELEDYRRLSAPLLYGMWNAAAQAQAAAEPAQFAQPATDGFYAGFEPDPTLPKRLASLAVPVLLVVGEYDIWPTCAAVRELAALLDNADLGVLPRAGHFPWVDDPATFTATVAAFLGHNPGTVRGLRLSVRVLGCCPSPTDRLRRVRPARAAISSAAPSVFLATSPR